MLHAMIGDPALRWVVTVLFGVSVAMYAYVAVAQRDQWIGTVNHLIHLTMSLAMVLMVWRIGLGLPATGPILFFLLAGVWFLCAAVWAKPVSRQRLKTCYYAAMMGAMAWMYALMSGVVPSVPTHLHPRPDSGAVMDMPGMQLPPRDMPSVTIETSWVAAANCILMAGFAAVALYWSYRFLGERRITLVPTTTRPFRWEPLYQASTAAGTALMFDALLW